MERELSVVKEGSFLRSVRTLCPAVTEVAERKPRVAAGSHDAPLNPFYALRFVSYLPMEFNQSHFGQSS